MTLHEGGVDWTPFAQLIESDKPRHTEEPVCQHQGNNNGAYRLNLLCAFSLKTLRGTMPNSCQLDKLQLIFRAKNIPNHG